MGFFPLCMSVDRSMFLYHLNSLKVSQNHEIIYINRMTNSHFPGSNQACYKLENLNYWKCEAALISDSGV